MSTFRTGNHWGVTIVQEGEDVVHLITDGSATTTCCGKTPFELPRRDGHRLTVEQAAATCPRRTGDELVAVVVNGDRELAERICALLNGDRPASTYTEPSVEDWDGVVSASPAPQEGEEGFFVLSESERREARAEMLARGGGLITEEPPGVSSLDSRRTTP